VIDPGPRTLRDPGSVATFHGGRFLGTEVPLGQALVDADSRLLVVGGVGRSDGPPDDLKNFANNDNWFDDVSDGVVMASVEVSGAREPVQAAAAWMIVAPPDFAPQITNFVTLYDVAFQAAVERAWLSPPETPSFTRHILPILTQILHRLVVDHGFGSVSVRGL
jgi:hypothetical protein